MVKPGFSHFHMEKWHITIATRILPIMKLDGVISMVADPPSDNSTTALMLIHTPP